MIELQFDNRGYLQPPGITEISLRELKQVFWGQFETSVTRGHIFSDYQRYVEDLFDLIQTDFTQWIDGSFISLKTNPKDIDFVSFINFEVYSRLESQIDRRFSKWAVRNYYQSLEAFTIWEYPESHRFHNVYLADRLYWYDWFGSSKYNRAKKRYPKGFIQIKIDATWDKQWE